MGQRRILSPSSKLPTYQPAVPLDAAPSDKEMDREAARNQREAEREARMQEREDAAAQKDQERAQKDQERDQLHQRNNVTEADLRTRGVKQYTDADSVIRPQLDPLTGKEQTMDMKGPMEYDQNGEAFQMERKAGKWEQKRPDAGAKIGPNPDDPNDPGVYKQNKEAPWQYIDPNEGVSSDDPAVRSESAKKLQQAATRKQKVIAAQTEIELSKIGSPPTTKQLAEAQGRITNGISSEEDKATVQRDATHRTLKTKLAEAKLEDLRVSGLSAADFLAERKIDPVAERAALDKQHGARIERLKAIEGGLMQERQGIDEEAAALAARAQTGVAGHEMPALAEAIAASQIKIQAWEAKMANFTRAHDAVKAQADKIREAPKVAEDPALGASRVQELAGDPTKYKSAADDFAKRQAEYKAEEAAFIKERDARAATPINLQSEALDQNHWQGSRVRELSVKRDQLQKDAEALKSAGSAIETKQLEEVKAAEAKDPFAQGARVSERIVALSAEAKQSSEKIAAMPDGPEKEAAIQAHQADFGARQKQILGEAQDKRKKFYELVDAWEAPAKRRSDFNHANNVASEGGRAAALQSYSSSEVRRNIDESQLPDSTAKQWRNRKAQHDGGKMSAADLATLAAESGLDPKTAGTMVEDYNRARFAGEYSKDKATVLSDHTVVVNPAAIWNDTELESSLEEARKLIPDDKIRETKIAEGKAAALKLRDAPDFQISAVDALDDAFPMAWDSYIKEHAGQPMRTVIEGFRAQEHLNDSAWGALLTGKWGSVRAAADKLLIGFGAGAEGIAQMTLGMGSLLGITGANQAGAEMSEFVNGDGSFTNAMGRQNSIGSEAIKMGVEMLPLMLLNPAFAAGGRALGIGSKAASAAFETSLATTSKAGASEFAAKLLAQGVNKDMAANIARGWVQDNYAGLAKMAMAAGENAGLSVANKAAIFATAGMQSAGYIQLAASDAYRGAAMAELIGDRDPESIPEAEMQSIRQQAMNSAAMKARPIAGLAGVVTGLLTTLLPKGAESMEALALPGKALSMPVADFVAKLGMKRLGEYLKSGTVMAGISSFLVTMGINVADETIEEFSDELFQNLLAKATYDPTSTFGDAFAAALHAGALGGLMGGVGGFAGSVNSYKEARAPQADAKVLQDGNATALATMAATPSATIMQGISGHPEVGAVDFTKADAAVQAAQSRLASSKTPDEKAAAEQALSESLGVRDNILKALAGTHPVTREMMGAHDEEMFNARENPAIAAEDVLAATAAVKLARGGPMTMDQADLAALGLTRDPSGKLKADAKAPTPDGMPRVTFTAEGRPIFTQGFLNRTATQFPATGEILPMSEMAQRVMSVPAPAAKAPQKGKSGPESAPSGPQTADSGPVQAESAPQGTYSVDVPGRKPIQITAESEEDAVDQVRQMNIGAIQDGAATLVSSPVQQSQGESGAESSIPPTAAGPVVEQLGMSEGEIAERITQNSKDRSNAARKNHAAMARGLAKALNRWRKVFPAIRIGSAPESGGLQTETAGAASGELTLDFAKLAATAGGVGSNAESWGRAVVLEEVIHRIGLILEGEGKWDAVKLWSLVKSEAPGLAKLARSSYDQTNGTPEHQARQQAHELVRMILQDELTAEQVTELNAAPGVMEEVRKAIMALLDYLADLVGNLKKEGASKETIAMLTGVVDEIKARLAALESNETNETPPADQNEQQSPEPEHATENNQAAKRPSVEDLVKAGLPNQEAEKLVKAWDEDTEVSGGFSSVDQIVANYNQHKTAYSNAETIKQGAGSLADYIEDLEVKGLPKKAQINEVVKITKMDRDTVGVMIDAVRRFRGIPSKPMGLGIGLTMGDSKKWDDWRAKKLSTEQSPETPAGNTGATPTETNQDGQQTKEKDGQEVSDEQLRELNPAAPAAEAPAPAAERPPLESKLGLPAGAVGDVGAVSQNGKKVTVRFAAVERKDLKASHNSKGEVTPGYDQTLQPRDRSLAEYRKQAQNIGQNLSFDTAAFFPETSTPATTADLGSPVMDQNYQVVIGNGRTIGIDFAYGNGEPAAARYKADFKANAAAFGIDPETVAGMKEPVLVRVIDQDISPADLVKFSQESNKGAAMASNAVEVAAEDATRITPELLAMLDPNFDLDAKQNDDFRKAYMQRVILGRSERGREGSNEANLTPAELAARIRRGIFASAFGLNGEGRAALDRMAGDTDDSAKKITKGLLAVAGPYAWMRGQIAAGAMHGMDISPEIGEAAQAIAIALRDRGKATARAVYAGMEDQQDMPGFSSDLKGMVQALLLRERASSSRVAHAFSNYVEAVNQLGDPRQMDMFGAPEIPGKAELFARVTSSERLDADEDGHAIMSRALTAAVENPLYPHASDGDFRSNWKVAAAGREVRLADGRVATVTEVGKKSYTVKVGKGKAFEVGKKEVWTKLTPEELEVEPFFIGRIAKFKELKSGFDAKLGGVVAQVDGLTPNFGAYSITAPLKGAPRALEKAGDKLAKDRTLEAEAKAAGQTYKAITAEDAVKSLHDIVRATLLVDAHKQVQGATGLLLRAFAQGSQFVGSTYAGAKRYKTPDGKVEILIDDRFTTPTPGGYSDVQIKVEIAPGYFAELQVNIPEMMVAKEGNEVKEMTGFPEKYWPENLPIPGYDVSDRSGHYLYEGSRSTKDNDLADSLLAEMYGLYVAAKDAHEARVANEESISPSVRTFTKGSSPVGTSVSVGTLPPGKSKNPLRPGSTAMQLPDSSRKNLVPGGNLSGSNLASMTPDNTAESRSSQGKTRITSKNIQENAGTVDVSTLKASRDGAIPKMFDLSKLREAKAAGKVAKIVPIASLVSLKDETQDPKFKAGMKADPRQTAANAMVATYNGLPGSKRRAPLDVTDNGDGTFTIIDGNATAQAAMLAGFPFLPVIVQEAATINSRSLTDDNYKAAVEGGDVAKQKQIIASEAAARGYESGAAMHHGTDALDFDVFDASKTFGGLGLHWFIDVPAVASSFTSAYTDRSKPKGRVISAYLDPGKTLDLDTPAGLKVMEGLVEKSPDPKIPGDWARPSRDARWTPLKSPGIVQAIRQLGYDSIRITRPNPEQYNWDDPAKVTTLAVFDANRIKSADPITRDKAGEIIPPSQRFDRGSDSVLNSRRISSEQMDLFGGYIETLPLVEQTPKGVAARVKKELPPAVAADLFAWGQNGPTVGNEQPDIQPGSSRPSGGKPKPKTAKKPGGSGAIWGVAGENDLFDFAAGLGGTGLGGSVGPVDGSGGRGDGSLAPSGGPDGGADSGDADSSGGMVQSGDSGGVGGNKPSVIPQPEAEEDRNARIDSSVSLVPKSQSGKIEANFEVIALMRQLSAEGRNPTTEEKEVLLTYSGWGHSKQVFDDAMAARFAAMDSYIVDRIKQMPDAEARRVYGTRPKNRITGKEGYSPYEIYNWNKKWGEIHARIKEEFSAEEYSAANRSVLNAHYTTPEVIMGKWKIAEKLGFIGGKALEPGAGIGHYIGTQPKHLAERTSWSAVELDTVTAKILALLYPQVRVNSVSPKPGREISGQGFEEALIPNNSQDLVFSNVPFFEEGPWQSEEQYKMQFNLHNYFFARALQKVKPGGIVGFITSSSTMENNPDQRKWLAAHGDLVVAVRLPNTAFKENAGTEVTTDIIFLRKPDGRKIDKKNWVERKVVGRGMVTMQRNLEKTFNQHLKGIDLAGVWQESRLAAAMADWLGAREAEGEETPEGLDANAKREVEKARLKASSDAWAAYVTTFEIVEGETPNRKLDIEVPIRVNEYFADNPDHVFGIHSLAGSMYGAGEYTLNPDPNGPTLEERFADLVEKLPANIMGQESAAPAPEAKDIERGDQKGSYIERDGKVWRVGDDALEPVDWTFPQLAIFRSWSKVVNDLIALINAEANYTSSNEKIEALRAKLNESYDAHVARYGAFIKTGKDAMHGHLEDDPVFDLTASLESAEKFATAKGKIATRYIKQDIFRTRMNKPPIPPTSAEDLPDAILQSMMWMGYPNVPYMAKLLKKHPEEVEAALADSDLAFLDPESGLYTDRDSYLTGHVQGKLDFAIEAELADPAFAKNVTALKKALPERQMLGEIGLNLASSWLPYSVRDAYLEQLGIENPSVEYSKDGNIWEIKGTGSVEQFATQKISTLELLRHALEQTEPMLTTTEGRGRERRTVPDPSGTALAKTKLKALKADFEKWAKTTEGKVGDKAIGSIIEENFNKICNGHVQPKMAGEHITLPGASEDVYRSAVRRGAIARMLSEGSGLIAHGVGFGKTYTLIGLAMELKRLGKANRPMIVVENATLSQFTASFRVAYPTARLLVADKNTFSEKNRKRFIAQIATGNYDCIVIPHSSFNLIPNTEDAVNNYIDAQIAELEIARGQVDKKDRRAVAALEAAKINLNNSRMKLIAKLKKRQGGTLAWEELGVDALLVDEAHRYKNAPVITRMKNLKNLPTAAASQRAIGMTLKALNIQGRMGGRGVFFATGTPISNTIAEAYIMMRYTSPHILHQQQIYNFDQFAAQYATTVVAVESNWKGALSSETRFAKYVNGIALLQMIGSSWDIQMDPDVAGINRPEMKGGTAGELRLVVPGPANQAYNSWVVNSVARQWDDPTFWHGLGGRKQALEDNPWMSAVPIMTMQAGIAAALDIRLVDSNAPDFEGSKINLAVKDILKTYHATHDLLATQAVFSDLRNDFSMDHLVAFAGDPGLSEQGIAAELDDEGNAVEGAKKKKKPKKFDVFNDLKEKLMKGSVGPNGEIIKGIPASQIAIISSSMKADRRAEIFAKVNSGEIRVVLGSSDTMGVGVNIQERLIKMHHLMPPRDFKPSTMEQRTGRILRQGNMFYDLQVEAYVSSAEKTLGKSFRKQKGGREIADIKAAKAALEGNTEGQKKAQAALDELLIESVQYAMEKSIDSPVYSMMASKQRGAVQLLSGKAGNNFEDPNDSISMGMAEIAALTIGDPDLIRMVELVRDIRGLQQEYEGWLQDASMRAGKLRHLQWEVQDYDTSKIPAAKLFEKALAPVGADEAKETVWEFGEVTIDRNRPEDAPKGWVAPKLIEAMDYYLNGETVELAKNTLYKRRLLDMKVDGVSFTVELHQSLTGQANGYVRWAGPEIYTQYLYGAHQSEFKGAQSLVQAVSKIVRYASKTVASYEATLADAKKQLATMEAAPEEEFEHHDKLESMRAEHDRLEETLATANPSAESARVAQSVAADAAREEAEREARPVAPVDPELATPEVMEVLRRSSIEGNEVTLPENLDRKLYLKVNEALESAGGKWDKVTKTHLFTGPMAEALGIADADTERDITKREQRTPEEDARPGQAPTGYKFKTKGDVEESIANSLVQVAGAPAMIAKMERLGITPDELYVAHKTGNSWYRQPTHKHVVANAIDSKKAVSARAVTQYKLNMPDGYVRRGALQVFDQAAADAMAPEAPAPKEYAYALRQRPFGIGAQPPGHSRLDEGDERGRYGVVYYAAPLSDESMRNFELKRVFDSNQKFRPLVEEDLKADLIGKMVIPAPGLNPVEVFTYWSDRKQVKAGGATYGIEGMQVQDDGGGEVQAEDAGGASINSRPLDKKTAAKLENGPKATRYRAMALIDGKLYPPMSTSVDGGLRSPEPIGEWMQAEERPDLVPATGRNAGKFRLKGPNGADVWAIYAPYFHSSQNPLNDQFSAAYKKPLVTVEIEIPAKDTYNAEGSKRAVGEHKWAGGRVVSLSRYAKIKRIVPDSEVAQLIAKSLPKGAAVADNVVTPSLRKELQKAGVKITESGLVPAGGAAINSRSLTSGRAVPADTSNVVEMPDGARMVGPTSFAINSRAFHGTPHKVDRFSLDKIGTGEGVQAYGWGLYFAESKGVAKSYKEKLTHGKRMDAAISDDRRIEAMNRLYEHNKLKPTPTGPPKVKGWGALPSYTAKEQAELDQWEDEHYRLTKEQTEIEATALEDAKARFPGNIYTVDLLPDEGDFLDWDKPLSEQSAKVKAALGKQATRSITGRELYELIGKDWSSSYAYRPVGGPRKASKWLSDAGIPGIKYLDGQSRDGGEGTRNYVIFDDKLVKILEENGKPVEQGGAINSRALRNPEFGFVDGMDAAGNKIKRTLVRFASGMSSIFDAKVGTYVRGGYENYGVGFDVGLLSKPAIDLLAHRIINLDTQVFIDSGAFSHFKRGLKEQAEGRTIKPLDFDAILKKYDDILAAIAEVNAVERTDYPRPLLVMPDIIGDQEASLALVEKYKNRIAIETSFNLATPIIPIPLGKLSLSEAYSRIVEILNSNTVGSKIDPSKFIVGIPSNAEAVSKDALAKFLVESKPRRIHFLGAAADSNLGPLLSVVARNSPDTLVTADASKVRSAILNGVAKGKTREQAIIDALVQEDDPESVFNSLDRGGAAINSRSFTGMMQDAGVDLDKLDELTALGQVGNPDRSLSMGPGSQADPLISSARAYHDETHRQMTDEELNAEARRIVDSDYEGTLAYLVDLAYEMGGNGTLSGVMNKAAQLIMEQESRKPLTQERQRLLQALSLSYYLAGSNQSEAFRARKDIFKTPEQRHREALANLIMLPPTWLRKRFKKADAAQKRKLLEHDATTRIARIEAAFSKMGLSIEEVLNGEVSLGLVNSAAANAAVDTLPAEARAAIRLVQKQEGTKEDVIKATGMTEAQIRQAAAAARAAFIADGLRRAKLAAQSAALSAQPIKRTNETVIDYAAMAKMTPAEQVRYMEKLADMAGLVDDATLWKRKAKKVKLFTPGKVMRRMPDYEPVESKDGGRPTRGLQQSLQFGAFPPPENQGQTTLTGAGDSSALDPAKPNFDAPRVPPVGGGSGKTGPVGVKTPGTDRNDPVADALGKLWVDPAANVSVRVGADMGNVEDMVRLSRIAQAADASGLDMVKEYWVNNILSGPMTQVANISGNFLSGAWEFTFQRGFEALWNAMAFQDPNSPQIGEMKYILGAMGPAAANASALMAKAWRTESDFFHQDMGQGQKELFETGVSGEKRKIAIGGKTGRVVRVPGRALMAMDGWFKGMIGTMEAAAQAYRIAKAEGLHGAALQARVIKLTNTPGSQAWMLAIKKAEELVFQNDLPEYVKIFQQFVNSTKIGSFVFPFIKTPFNIMRTGIRKSPLGLFNLVYHMGKTGLVKIGKGGSLEATPTPKMIQYLAEQTLSFIALAAIFGAAAGDDDDDKKQFFISGSPPRNRGQKALAEKEMGGGYVIRIGGVEINYGRYEPVATVLGTMIDGIKAFKSGMTGPQVLSAIMDNFKGQVMNKSFLSGIAGIIDGLENEGKWSEKMRSAFLQAIVPNLVRQPLRASDANQRDYSDADWWYPAWPSAGNAGTPLIDPTSGEERLKGGNALSRALIVPVAPRGTLTDADRTILAWNKENPLKAWAPPAYTKEFTYSPKSGSTPSVKVELNENHHRFLQVRTATLAQKALAGKKIEANQEGIDEIRKAYESAHRQVTGEIRMRPLATVGTVK